MKTSGTTEPGESPKTTNDNVIGSSGNGMSVTNVKTRWKSGYAIFMIFVVVQYLYSQSSMHEVSSSIMTSMQHNLDFFTKPNSDFQETVDMEQIPLKEQPPETPALETPALEVQVTEKDQTQTPIINDTSNNDQSTDESKSSSLSPVSVSVKSGTTNVVEELQVQNQTSNNGETNGQANQTASSQGSTEEEEKEDQPPMTSLLPWSNVTTFLFKEGYLYSGFRNQIQAFTILIFEAIQGNHGQIIIESLPMKDLHGSNKRIPFEHVWDIEHWNSYYPSLPRLVHYDPILHDHYNPKSRFYTYKNKEGNITDSHGNILDGWPTRPVFSGMQTSYMHFYRQYTKGKGKHGRRDGSIHPAEKLILSGALRPHKDLREIVDRKLASIQAQIDDRKGSEPVRSPLTSNTSHAIDYVALHARVEGDMQRHTVCLSKKVLELSDIIKSVEKEFPDPPAKAIFIPINRIILEKEGYPDKDNPNMTNWIGVRNLQTFNHILEHGLWNGTVPVFQMGAPGLKGTKFENRSSVTGSLLDYYIALESKMFIGAPVSSFSHALAITRFHRGDTNNWKYLPGGLKPWTPPGIKKPPPFEC